MVEPAHLAGLEQALAREGLSLSQLRREARAIALFGSRAGRCAVAASDWDVLCIGRGRSSRLGAVDCVWVEPRSLVTPRWLGGDLSGHVAAHGQWIHGGPWWDLGAVDFPATALRKEARLVRYLRALSGTWNLMGAAYQDKHARAAQLDVWRWSLLLRGVPVAPSALLPDPWGGGDAAHAEPRSYEDVLVAPGRAAVARRQQLADPGVAPESPRQFPKSSLIASSLSRALRRSGSLIGPKACSITLAASSCFRLTSMSC